MNNQKRKTSEQDSESASDPEVEDLGDSDYDTSDGYAEDEDDEFDFDADEEEDILMFDDIGSEKEKKGKLQVDYEVRSLGFIKEYYEKQLQSLSNTFSLPMPFCCLLLQHFKWKLETLSDRYLTDPERTLEDAGVFLPSSTVASPGLSNNMTNYTLNSPVACDVKGVNSSAVKFRHMLPHIEHCNDFRCRICTDSGSMDTFGLNCGHRFCTNCFKHFLTQKIMEEGQVARIACPNGLCKALVDSHSVELLVAPNTLERYERYTMSNFVDHTDWLKWCPGPNCDRAIECHFLQVDCRVKTPVVTCSCGTNFCFNCLEEDHRPCICEIVRRWLKKCNDESETANYISANTKECPKCHTNIEKNGGCNHMTCKKCTFEFCWVCLGDWASHGSQFYQCNRFDDESGKEARARQDKSRESLLRYLHYFRRYQNHDESAKAAQLFFKNTEQKMESLQRESDMSWIEVQYMSKAVQVQVEARVVLKWTYAFGYYLENEKLNNHTKLFQDNQRDLESAVEDLSELLEKPIETDREKTLHMKQKILDKENYVSKRKEVLLNDTYQGFLDKRWTYTFGDSII